MLHAPEPQQPAPIHARGAEGVGEAYVVSVGEQLLHGFWVSFYELVARPLELFEYSVKIIYSSHVELTSTVGTSSFP